MRKKTVRPDAKGRINLDKFASFSAPQDEANCVVLGNLVEIPAHEKWLFNNKNTLNQVKKGIKDSAAGNISSRDSFSQYIEDDKE